MLLLTKPDSHTARHQIPIKGRKGEKKLVIKINMSLQEVMNLSYMWYHCHMVHHTLSKYQHCKKALYYKAVLTMLQNVSIQVHVRMCTTFNIDLLGKG